MELVIPPHAIRGQNVRLDCNFNLDNVNLYSVKWYKDGNEFYRYLPGEQPPVQVFTLPGVTVDIHNSTERSVVLQSVNLMSSGRYRCEVSGEAPAFQTVSEHSDMQVVAVPEEGPKITGRTNRYRYQVSDVVRFNCTSSKSKPVATLSWFINGDPVDQQLLRGPYLEEQDRDGLQNVTLGLEFRIKQKHFKRGDMKIKCLANIATVYWKSNELSIEGYRPEQNKVPVMESRETRPQGHTHAEHILASANAAQSRLHCGLPMLLVVAPLLRLLL
uniref:Ig-like domain-containing protein n=1 Tax=Trichogramma kaykai TaxID=54128 RepID=A0ABD2WHF5_9HYME